ncbi:VOC family protein [Prauserella cavernicola]|uniref:Putative pterin-4-alpha-carbinolamine dehydratase n=1 Tax=Prauserella cavernicola TaxID=2800127 RepID=A0A934QP70_9PSEU|nr:VOC family protein [Prauserella cavernicola]MBK1783602.1 4a-hydroxytetrahydrobiopterin dehydratase [Prauserella cavernicola]
MTQPNPALGVEQVELADWRWLLGMLRARFEAGSFGAGAEFVAVVGRLCDADDSHPDVDLRAGQVQFVLRDHDTGGVTEREVRLAERISALALEHGLTPVPDRVQVLELALDTPEREAVLPFWAAVLGGDETAGQVADPARELPPLWFQTTGSTAPDRQRFHLDVTVPPELAEERITAAIAAGGRVVDDGHAPAFVVLADPDGNKACVCTELGRD